MKRKTHWISLMLGVGVLTGWCFFSPVYAEETISDQPVQDGFELTETDLEETNQLGEEEHQQEAVVNQTDQQITNKESELADVQSQLPTIEQEINTQQSVATNLNTKEAQAKDVVNQANTQFVSSQRKNSAAITTKASAAKSNEVDNLTRQTGKGFFESLGLNFNDADALFKNNTDLTDKYDAFSLDQMLKALDQIKFLNNLRKNHGLPELKVSPTLMMHAAYEANVIRKVEFNHVKFKDSAGNTYRDNQNIAMGYDQPFDGWYTEEKKNYEQNNGGVTGHYLTIINSEYNTTGYAIAGYNKSAWVYEDIIFRYDINDFAKDSSFDDEMSVAEFERLFMAYFFDGYVTSSFTGLAKASNGKWYFFRNGKHEGFTGFAQSATNGKWYFSRNGFLDWNFTGVAKSIANGQWYHAKNGCLDWGFTGFSKSVADGKWYFSRKGKLDWNFTGVAKSVADGKWYHAKKGRLDWTFTGFSKSVADGKWYFSREGKLDWKFTGVAKSVSDGKWYFARNGRLDWGFTGVGRSWTDGKWYAVHKGKLNWNYNGGAISSSNGRWYAVQRGQLNWNYTGWMRCHDGLFRYFYRGVA